MNRNFSNIKQLEQNYNPRESVINFQDYLKETLNKSIKAETELSGYRDIQYGKGPLQKLDIFESKGKKNKPIHIFIHGGYWRALDKNYHYHMALPFNKNEINFCNLNYDLCPLVSLKEISKQMIQAIIWIYKNASKYNYDRESITISGHSAGAHLASYLLTINWENFDLPNNIFKGAALISGIFDLKIVRQISVNEDIKLTDIEVKELSTINKMPNFSLPLIVAYGEKEPKGWKEQSLEYKKNLINNKFQVSEILCKADNHFSLIDTLADEESTICKSIISLAKL